MKRIIKGITYNTRDAVLLATEKSLVDKSCRPYIKRELYETTDKRYFMLTYVTESIKRAKFQTLTELQAMQRYYRRKSVKFTIEKVKLQAFENIS